MSRNVPVQPTPTDADQITLSYTHTLDEHMHAARIYRATTRKHQVYRVIGFLAVFGAAWTLFTGGFAALALLWFIIGLFAWFNPMPLLMIYLTYRQSPRMQQPYEVRFDSQGAKFKIGNEQFARTWEKYRQVLESDRVFLLVVERWHYSLIPKRAFDEQTMAAFRELLTQRMKAVWIKVDQRFL